MSWALTAQTCGSIAVIGAFAASEAAAHYLSAHPDSGLAWYLNLQVFRPFENARVAVSPLQGLFGPNSMWVALLALGLTTLFRAIRFEFGLALFSNLSFVFAAFLAHSWMAGGAAVKSVSLNAGLVATSGNGALIAALLLASTLAAAFGHLSFLNAILSRASRVRPGRRC